MHGMEVIRMFREENPQIVSIIITAFCSRQSVAEAREWGVDEYFEKPLQIQPLKDAITRGIAQRALRNA
jgi:DNA-binding NtrC family response regulator